MKELSIEEKAKRYDKAIEQGKQILNTPYTAHWDIMKEVVEHLLPELAESEDDRIGKKILKLIKEHSVNHERCQMEAWLEKQGEHANFRNKIQIGDKVTRNEDGILVNLSQLNRVAKKDEKQVEQKDILEDTVLDSNKDGLIAYTIRCKREKQSEQKPTIIIPKFRVGDEIKTTNEEPLTITKIDEKGYWSEDLFICDFDDEVCWDLVEQKPAEWSEEDEKMIENIIDTINTSIEDCDVDDIGTKARFSLEKERDWLKNKLKFLRPQNYWKPSDEQMELIKDIVFKDRQKITRKELAIFHSIYNDLKKLMEE